MDSFFDMHDTTYFQPAPEQFADDAEGEVSEMWDQFGDIVLDAMRAGLNARIEGFAMGYDPDFCEAVAQQFALMGLHKSQAALAYSLQAALG